MPYYPMIWELAAFEGKDVSITPIDARKFTAFWIWGQAFFLAFFLY